MYSNNKKKETSNFVPRTRFSNNHEVCSKSKDWKGNNLIAFVNNELLISIMLYQKYLKSTREHAQNGHVKELSHIKKEYFNSKSSKVSRESLLKIKCLLSILATFVFN